MKTFRFTDLEIIPGERLERPGAAPFAFLHMLGRKPTHCFLT